MYNTRYIIFVTFAYEFTMIIMMNQKILLTILISSMVSLGYNANAADFRAVYDFEYTKDSIHSIKEKDILYLEITESGKPFGGSFSLPLSQKMESMRLLSLISVVNF